MRWIDLDAELIPDDRAWGQGWGGRPYSAADLDEIRQNIAETVQPGYDARLHRLGWNADAPVVVPPGFDAAGHPNRGRVPLDHLDPDITTTDASEACLQQVHPGVLDWARARGWSVDQHGRPVHPHHTQLLADPEIGLPTGLGFGWYVGETIVADAVIYARGHTLLIDRTTDDGTIPALPGGYAIPADVGRTVAQWRAGDRPVTPDGIITTAARKTTEETGLALPRWCSPRLIRGCRPISSPHTLHAWTATITVLFDLGDQLPAIDRAAPARWVIEHERDDLIGHGTMWPDHQRALHTAFGL